MLVADDAQLAVLRQRGKVELQGIGLMQPEAGLEGEALLQMRGQVAIDLDGIEPLGGLEQGGGHHPLARADFQQVIAGARVDGHDDALHHAVIAQKVLSEALARRVIHGGARLGWGQCARRRARSAAASIAASKLPGSARPLPARSRAVPWSTEVRMIGRPRVMLTARPKPRCLSTGSPWS